MFSNSVFARKPEPKELGAHVVVGLFSVSLSPAERKLLREVQAAGVILYGRNIAADSPNWQKHLATLLQAVRNEIQHPQPLIAIDHEGGRVHRFPNTTGSGSARITHFAEASRWTDPADVGQTMGRELRALGINLNFAPVLDCWSNEQNTVIGERAFSREFAGVSAPAVAFARALEAAGVLSCGKHFPGHGATVADSHFSLPECPKNLEELAEQDLRPFREYIAAGFSLLMSSHVLYPKLDQSLPASLSPTISTDLLRNSLKYQGALITDDLVMKALDGFSFSARLRLALQAGADLIILGDCSATPALEVAMEAIEELRQDVQGGLLPSSRLEQAKTRIGALHQSLVKASAVVR